MIYILARCFIKDYKNYSSPQVREKYGLLCGVTGFVFNILLFVIKFILGLASASVALMADAFNNLSDSLSSVVQFLGFKLSGKIPDKEHPFGHGRLEYVSGLIISFFVLIMGVNIFKTSIESILHPSELEVSFYTFAGLAVSILIKFYMLSYSLIIGRKIKSVAIKAVATDSLSDCLASSFVIISIAFSKYTSLPLDGIMGVIVSCFILYGGVCSVKETLSPLLGNPPSKEFVEEIENMILENSSVIGMHDLVVHDYGPGHLMVSLHVEVPGNKNIFELHDVIDKIESEIETKFNCHALVHMDPVDVDDESLVKIRGLVRKIVQEFSPSLKAHDIRFVNDENQKKLVFEIEKPFDFKGDDDSLIEKISARLKEFEPDVDCMISVELPML